MSALNRIPTTDPSVLAFQFSGRIESDDLEAMAASLDEAFDRLDSISLLLLFRAWDGVELSAVFDPDVVKAQFRALAHVERYAVVGAPDGPETLIEVMDALIPVDARTFDPEELSLAWDFVGALPAGPATD